MLQLDSINARSQVQERSILGDNCPGYFNGQVFSCDEEEKKKKQIVPIFLDMNACVFQEETLSTCGDIGVGGCEINRASGQIISPDRERSFTYLTETNHEVFVGDRIINQSGIFEFFYTFSCLDLFNRGELGMSIQFLNIENSNAASATARLFRSDNNGPWTLASSRSGLDSGDNNINFPDFYNPHFSPPGSCSVFGDLTVRFRLQFKLENSVFWWPTQGGIFS